MARAEVVELPIVGRRSPEIQRLVRILSARVASSVPETDESGSTGRWIEREPMNVVLRHTVVVNALGERGSMAPERVTKLVRAAVEEQPERTVIVALDEESPEVVRAALDAGASDYLGRDAIENEEAVYWRLRNAALLSRLERTRPEPARSGKPGPVTIRKSGRLSAAAVRAADEAIDAAVGALPGAEERRALGTGVLEIVAPELRDAESGRLNAKRMAEATGLSLTTLARASGVTQQALSAKPDSPTAQAGLLPVGRLSCLLDELLAPEHKRAWLQTPHPRFGDRSPKQAIEEGDAELVTLIVEAALEGSPD